MWFGSINKAIDFNFWYTRYHKASTAQNMREYRFSLTSILPYSRIFYAVFYELLSRSFDSLLLLNRYCLLSALLLVFLVFSSSSLASFIRCLSVSLIHAHYYPSFYYIMKKQFRVRCAVFLQVYLVLPLLVLKEHYISLLSGFSFS